MSSKVQSAKITKKRGFRKKQIPPEKPILKRTPNVKTHQADDSDFDDSSLDEEFPKGYTSDDTDGTVESESSDISQEFSDEDKLMKYYETKVRRNVLLEPSSDDNSEESELPRELKEIMNRFRKQNSLSQMNNVIPCKLSTEPTTTSNKPSCGSSKNKVGRRKHGSTKNVLKHGSKKFEKISVGHNRSVVPSEMKRISKLDQRVPSKDEAVFQKSSIASFSNYSRGSDKKIPLPPVTVEPRRARRETLTELAGQKSAKTIKTVSTEIRPKPIQKKKVKYDNKEKRDTVIDYLCQIDEAEKALYAHSKLGEEDSTDQAEDTTTSRDAVLRKYGFELTSKDDLLKLGGATDRKRRRERRRMLFPSSSSSSSGTDRSFNENEIKSTLKSFLGRKASDVDVSEMVRHGRKWRNCLDDGECMCRPRNEKEEEQRKEDRNKKLQQFLSIFDGKCPPNDDYTREDLLKAHEKIGPWVHNKTKRLDKFIESGKYSPEYLLNFWDGRLSGESSGDEPNFDKYREEYQKKLKEHNEEDGQPIPPEDRVPTLEENNWFLFPTPVTRMYGNGESASPDPPNTRAAMESIASDLKRRREVERAKEYLEQRNFPVPHLYPRPIDLTKQEDTTNQIKHPLLGMMQSSTANK